MLAVSPIPEISISTLLILPVLVNSIKGDPDPETGFIFDAKKLGGLINDKVIEKLDHRNLNVDVDFMKGKLCSIENLVMGIWQELEPHLPPPVQLHCLKLVETAKIFVEYYGDK